MLSSGDGDGEGHINVGTNFYSLFLAFFKRAMPIASNSFLYFPYPLQNWTTHFATLLLAMATTLLPSHLGSNPPYLYSTNLPVMFT